MSDDVPPLAARLRGLCSPSYLPTLNPRRGDWLWTDRRGKQPDGPAYALPVALPRGPGDDWEPCPAVIPDSLGINVWPSLRLHSRVMALRGLAHACPCGEPTRERGDVCAECEPEPDYYAGRGKLQLKALQDSIDQTVRDAGRRPRCKHYNVAGACDVAGCRHAQEEACIHGALMGRCVELGCGHRP